ncbi:MAG: cyclic nucleotide-binding domain-containing protein, partial [Methylococcales bacterium]|nr:cyclic nucleotide-binding domain-containing protein [Methylococcales bacterium]
MTNKTHIEPEQLEQFMPFDKLSRTERKQLSGHITIKTLPVGKLLFKQGEYDNHSIFLLSGEVSLSSNGEVEQTIRAHTPHANTAIACQQPRQFSARAETDVTIFWLDRELIARMTQAERIDYQVDELESNAEDDWMVNMLQSPVFHEIPAANIQQVMVRFQQVNVKQDEVLIQQGDEGDFYYFLQEGECAVIRNDDKLNKDVQLAVLKSGDTFGEEALVSGRKRSTTVKMLTDGVVFKLSKIDFIDLIKDPVLRFVNYKDAETMIADGAQWLDVRSPEAHAKDGFEGSINIPTYALRYQIGKLDFNTQYVA